MKITVLSKKDFDNLMAYNNITNDNVEDIKDVFFISIHYTGTDSSTYYFENKSNVKVMVFDDCSFKHNHEVPMTEEQAIELLDFIDEHVDKEECIVHCAAGISRSGAVGTFICDYTDTDFNVFIQNNPQIHPNPLVLNLLKKAVLKKYNIRMY